MTKFSLRSTTNMAEHRRAVAIMLRQLSDKGYSESELIDVVSDYAGRSIGLEQCTILAARTLIADVRLLDT